MTPAAAPTGPAHPWTLPAVALGGVVGAAARRGLELGWPAAGDAVPWATFGTNVAGSALLGVLMVVVVERGTGHPLLRPLLGVGVLGGFTTFSTYAVQVTGLLDRGLVVVALAYLGGTALSAVLGVAAGVALARRLTSASTRTTGRTR